MEITATDFAGLVVLQPKVHRDERGFFLETYRKDVLEKQNIIFNVVQANHAFSTEAGVLRGLHFQAPPHAQAKLVWVTRGKVLDVVVDLRKKSPTYGRYFSIVLSADNFTRLLVPRGFAHGYLTLTTNSEFNYMVDEYYSPAHEGGVLWDDSDIAISWPLEEAGVSAPSLSPKDKLLPSFADFVSPF